jgi:hypothetical protein
MLFDHPTSTQLAEVIGQVTAPAFLLGAVAAFVSVLISRMNRIIDRLQALNAIGDDNPGKSQVKSDIPRLKRRAALLNKSILFAIISAIITSILVIMAFLTASLNVRHEYGVGVLFILSLGFFTASLVNLARETLTAQHEYDHFSSS